MRLIDADKLMENITKITSKSEYAFLFPVERDIVLEIIKSSTVEAIPVDFIRQWSQMMDLPENEMLIKDWQRNPKKNEDGYEL